MKPIQTPRTVDVAANELRSAILSGAFPAGERLPPERSLAEQMGISRLTLRAAVAHLAAEGLVKARQGSGVVVQDYRSAGVELLPHLVAQGRLDLLEPFLVLRRAVACEAMALAASQASDEDLAHLQQMADHLAIVPDRRELEAGNLAFAAEVIRIADNLPMTLLFNTVGRVLEARPEVAAALISDETAVRQSYGLIVSLLRQRDPDLARSASRIALEAIDRRTLEVLGQST